jgi:hypothetical protein
MLTDQQKTYLDGISDEAYEYMRRDKRAPHRMIAAKYFDDIGYELISKNYSECKKYFEKHDWNLRKPDDPDDECFELHKQ